MRFSRYIALLGVAIAAAEPAGDLDVLKQWFWRLDAALKDMSSTVQCEAATLEGVEVRDKFHIRQNVQRFGRLASISVQDEDVMNIEELLRAEAQEVKLKHKQLQLMAAFLEGNVSSDEKFDVIEVQHMATQARTVQHDQRTGKVELIRTSLLGSNTSHSCIYAVLAKPISMYVTPLIPAPSTEGNSSILLNLTQLTLRRQSVSVGWNFEEFEEWQTALDKFANHHSSVTCLWACSPGCRPSMGPCYGSGPEYPMADSHVSSSQCYSSPHLGSYNCCNLGFGWGALPAWILLAVSDGFVDQNMGLSYSDSCEFGPSTLSVPAEMQRNCCWMSPFSGEPLGSFSARQIPGRTCCGSHPCGSSFAGRRPKDYMPDLPPVQIGPPITETHLTKSSIYDPNLVRILYELDAQNASFQHVTFFTTTLLQLAAVGVRPSNAHYQHWGLEFAFTPKSAGIPFQFDGTGRRANIFSLEMMSDGLMWVLKEDDVPYNYTYFSERYEFEELPVRVLADFLLERKGMSYKDENCQRFARNLMDRVFIYGKSPRKISTYKDEVPLFATHAYILIGLAMAFTAVFWAVSLSILWRCCLHFWRLSPCEGRNRFHCFAIRLVQALRLLDDDLRTAETVGTKHVGSRLAFGCRVMFTWSFQLLAWMYIYDACCAVLAKFKSRKIDITENMVQKS